MCAVVVHVQTRVRPFLIPAACQIALAARTGIGLHLARQYLNNTQLQVVALSRNSAEARKAILDGGGSDDRLHTLDVDVREENTIAKAAETVKGRFGDDSLRLLFNVSGIVSASWATLSSSEWLGSTPG